MYTRKFVNTKLKRNCIWGNRNKKAQYRRCRRWLRDRRPEFDTFNDVTSNLDYMILNDRMGENRIRDLCDFEGSDKEIHVQ
jgi:hypothetical protein